MSAVQTIASEVLQRRTSPVFPPAPGWGPQTRGASAGMPIPTPICGSALAKFVSSP